VPELRVRRDDLASWEVVEGESLREDLGDWEVQMRVERFALSSNNITYAALGDQLGYWRLFPAPDGWGRIPAWGYARVVASRSPVPAEGGACSAWSPWAATSPSAPRRIRSGSSTPPRTAPS
jgi:Protein of unknown function (DUF2855)